MSTPRVAEFLISSLAATHGSQLLRFLIARLRDPVEAQDLAQETYLRLLRVDKPELIRRPEMYLFTIAINLVRELALKRAARPLHVALDDMRPEDAPGDAHFIDAATPEIAALQEERLRQLERTLERLPPKARAALIWHRRDGQTYEEIGARLGVSRNMVKKYLTRAVAECRKAREEERQGESP